MSAKIKYLSMLLKQPVNSQVQRLKYFMNVVKSVSVERGLTNSMIIDNLTFLHKFYNAIDESHPVHSELTETLSLFVKQISKTKIEMNMKDYIIEVVSHKKAATIHQVVYEEMVKILGSSDKESVRRLITIFAMCNFEAFEENEKNELFKQIEPVCKSLKVYKPMVLLVSDINSFANDIDVRGMNLYDKLDLYFCLSKEDKRFIPQLEMTMSDLFSSNYLNSGKGEQIIINVLIFLCENNETYIESFERMASTTMTKKMIKQIMPHYCKIAKNTIDRIVELTKNQVSGMYLSTDNKDSSFKFKNLLTFITEFVNTMKDNAVSEALLNYLIGLIQFPVNLKDEVILNCLPKFAMTNDEKLCDIILTQYLTFFKISIDNMNKIKDEDEKTRVLKMIHHIPELLVKYANNLTDKELKFASLVKIIEKFLQVSNSYSKKTAVEDSPIVLYMGRLFESIKVLIKGMESTIREKRATIFRTFWINVVVLKFCIQGKWSKEIYEEIKAITCDIPSLLIEKNQHLIELENEVTSVINKYYSETTIQQLINTLNPNTSAFTLPRGLTNERIVYFYALYYLETMRAMSGKCNHMFEYLEDPVIDDPLNESFGPIFLSIAKVTFTNIKKVLKDYTQKQQKPLEATPKKVVVSFNKSQQPAKEETNRKKAKSEEEERKDNATEIMTFLILKLTNWKEIIRNTASDYLMEIIEDVPRVLVNRKVLALLFDLINMIEKCDNDPLSNKAIKVPHTEYYINTPEDEKSSKLIITCIKQFINAYLQKAVNKSNRFVMQFIESFILNLSSDNQTHEGVKIFMKQCEGIVDMSEILFQVSEKSKYISIVQQPNYVLNKVSLNCIDDEDHWSEMIMEYASFIIIHGDSLALCSDVIDEVVASPFKLFTQKSIQTGIEVWEWILASASKEVGNYLLHQLVMSWDKTMERKVGIFDVNYEENNPLSASTKECEKKKKLYESDIPHRLILRFIEELFPIVSIYNDTIRLSLIKKLITSSLKGDFTKNNNSIGTIFLLFYNGLSVVKESNNYKLLYLIESKVLKLFENVPSWFECSRKRAEEDIQLLSSFNKCLYEQVAKIDDLKLTKKILPKLIKSAILVFLLVSNEVERITVWNNPLGRQEKIFYPVPLNLPQKYKKNMKDNVINAWNISPLLAIRLYDRFGDEDIKKQLERYILAQPSKVLKIADGHIFLATIENVNNNAEQLSQLLYWSPTDPPHALNLLKKSYNDNYYTTLYALRVIETFTQDTVIYYVPQLVQSLRYDDQELVEAFIVRMGKKYQLVAHQIIWNCDTYSTESTEMTVKADPKFVEKLKRICKKILENYDEEEMKYYKSERDFINTFTTISSGLIPLPREERLPALKKQLKEIKLERDDLYVPTQPNSLVLNVSDEGCACLRSAAKVPILVQTTIKDKNTNETNPLPIIFKAGDDIRSDMLAIQLIELFDRINKHSGLDLYLCPYHIIATGPDCGIIEVVQNSMSRDQIGEKTDGDLYSYFLQIYGGKMSDKFFNARSCFIRSMASYSIASYILQIKDRHNGNILIDKQGHVVHIDFGFIFDRTPGGDLGFERSPFKITDEMISIMGGVNSEQFIWFMEQGIKSFLSIRQYYPSVLTLVELMLDTQMNVFKPSTIENLKNRFFANESCVNSAQSMTKVICNAFSNMGKLFTFGYDKFQEMSNGISF